MPAKLISKKDFLRILGHEGFMAETLAEEIRDSWNDAVTLSQTVLEDFPKIGLFASPSKRLEGFFQVCEYFENKVAAGEVQYEATVLAVNVLRLSNKSFRRAVNCFEARITQGGTLDQDAVLSSPGGTFAWTYARMIQPDFARDLPLKEEQPPVIPDDD
ncbi:MAG: hypothetical protein ACNI27_01120 [Desulfovibrio sp.]